MLTLLVDDPGLGKSTLAIDLAARLSRGPLTPAPLPQGERGEATASLILSAEDDPARVIRPRLEAAGADLGRVFVLDACPGHPERPIELPGAVSALCEIPARGSGSGLVKT